MTENSGVCIVTQPHRSHASKDHAHDLADILSEITAVPVMTANLPADSSLAEEHEVVEISSHGAGTNVFSEAIRFLINQILFCRAISCREEETVLFFGTTSYLLPVIWSRLRRKRVVVLPRGNVPLSLYLRWKRTIPSPVAWLLSRFVLALEHANYHFAHGVVTYTPNMAQELGLGRYGHKLYPNGARFVDTQEFDIRVPMEERGQCIGFVGRLDVEKRVPELAAVAKQLPSDIRFVFIGDGDYRELLEDELADQIDEGSVEIVGWVDRANLPEQLNRLSLIIVPSHPTEGLPTAILEAMACGTPAYATAVSGVPDVVREGETGYLMDEVDAAQIASEVEQIVKNEDLLSMSLNARTLIENHYNFKSAVNRWEQILTDLK